MHANTFILPVQFIFFISLLLLQQLLIFSWQILVQSWLSMRSEDLQTRKMFGFLVLPILGDGFHAENIPRTWLLFSWKWPSNRKKQAVKFGRNAAPSETCQYEMGFSHH